MQMCMSLNDENKMLIKILSSGWCLLEFCFVMWRQAIESFSLFGGNRTQCFVIDDILRIFINFIQTMIHKSAVM